MAPLSIFRTDDMSRATQMGRGRRTFLKKFFVLNSFPGSPGFHDSLHDIKTCRITSKKSIFLLEKIPENREILINIQEGGLLPEGGCYPVRPLSGPPALHPAAS
jgi:hypothetical protein